MVECTENINIGGNSMKVISLINQKGGVGKSSATVNLATAFAKLGKKILVIDFDPQGDTTDYSNILEEQALTTKELLLERNLKDVIIKTTHYDLVPADISLADAEMALANKFSREFVLKTKLEGVRDYDFCLIDCPPSLTLLPINALVASHLALAPVMLERFSVKGLSSLNDTIREIKQVNHQLKLKFFVNKFDKRLKHNLDYYEAIKDAVSASLLNTVIRTDADISKSQAENKNIFDFNEKSKTAEDYLNLANEIMGGF